jgi:hypothetical protein
MIWGALRIDGSPPQVLLEQGVGASGADGRTMSSGNAAVQQSQQDVNYLTLELNLYISISIGIGTGLDIKNSPPDAKPDR